MNYTRAKCIMPDIKCVLVGDKNVGKEPLVVKYVKSKFPSEEIFYNGYQKYSKNVRLGETQINMSLWDATGDEEWDRVRTMLYPETNVILMCFSIDDPTSFQNISKKWYREVHFHCPDLPIILVGTKLDLREDKVTEDKSRAAKNTPITYQKGASLAEQIGAIKYVECSALTQQELECVFLQTIVAALNHRVHEVPELGYTSTQSQMPLRI
ncbi:unnamed protein product [Allacma fusca]|uniref:Uncharacterized protein n=1 Tax=Allacma fusca TaxID=39272 RepID=A0A8J2PNR3_9HEXA|nr:unnamed protein product [Allacma fusca]